MTSKNVSQSSADAYERYSLYIGKNSTYSSYFARRIMRILFLTMKFRGIYFIIILPIGGAVGNA